MLVTYSEPPTSSWNAAQIWILGFSSSLGIKKENKAANFNPINSFPLHRSETRAAERFPGRFETSSAVLFKQFLNLPSATQTLHKGILRPRGGARPAGRRVLLAIRCQNDQLRVFRSWLGLKALASEPANRLQCVREGHASNRTVVETAESATQAARDTRADA